MKYTIRVFSSLLTVSAVDPDIMVGSTTAGTYNI